MERKPNVKLLKKVRKLIAEEPRRLNMHTWGKRVAAHDEGMPPCGTVACLAGWTVFAAHPFQRLTMKLHRPGYERNSVDGDSVGYHAARLLGVNVTEAPFWQAEWGVPEVLAWIDRQIDAASK